MIARRPPGVANVDRLSFFDVVPEVYDRVRPAYPAALFDALFAFAATGLDCAVHDVVEAGPGTGQATTALLERGAAVTAVELGPNIAAFLAAKFAAEPRLTVQVGAFEEVDLPPASADMVVAATAYHWLDPAVRVATAHRLLRAAGVLAVIDTVQVDSPADRGYFAASQAIYDRYFPGEEPGIAPRPEQVRPAALGELRASPLFDEPRLWTWPWDQRYDTAAYINLVRSYSGTNRMPAGQREAFLADLAASIDREWDGYVVRPLVISLVAARACA